MKTFLNIVVFSIALHGNLSGQVASDYLPVLNSTWDIESIATIDDSLLYDSSRTDSLYSIETHGNFSIYSISTSEGYTYQLETRDDTLYVEIMQLLRFFRDYLLELAFDPEIRIPIAIFSAGVYDEWDGYELKQTIDLPESIIALLPDDLPIDEEADIELRIRGTRLPSETRTFLDDEILVQVFDSLIDFKATIYLLFAGERIPIPLDLLESFSLRFYIAFERGVVKHRNEEYVIVAEYRQPPFININEEITTLPATNSEMTKFVEGDPALIAEETQSYPEKFTLYQNFPNPFNPATQIRFSIAEQSHITLTVYDILGRKVNQLVNEELHPGVYTVRFEARNIPGGMYIYRLDTGAFIEQKSMVLVK